MALNWSIKKCKNWKQLTEDKAWPLTDRMIWATMYVDIGSITKANHEEFYRRLHIVEQQDGAFLMRGGKESYITLADVKRYIGLETNVGKSSKKEFAAKRQRLMARKNKEALDGFFGTN